MLKCQCGESSPPSSPQVRVGATSVAVCHLHRERGKVLNVYDEGKSFPTQERVLPFASRERC